MEIRSVAINFIKSLTKNQKEKLKIMLEHNVVCCSDYAKKYEVRPEDLTNELKLIFGGK